MEGRLVVTGATIFELQLYTQVGKSGDGLGTPTGDGFTEYYNEMIVRRCL